MGPLLCAGITTYSPLRHWKIGKGHKVGVLGLGGLGHMAVKFASVFGARVTVFSTSPSKEGDAKRLGADDFALSSDLEKMKKLGNYFDFIIDTVSAPHDYNAYLGLLRTNGVMICVGIPPDLAHILPQNIILARRSISGSLIGGLPETQEMLNYCAKHKIMPDVEVIPIQQIDDQLALGGDLGGQHGIRKNYLLPEFFLPRISHRRCICALLFYRDLCFLGHGGILGNAFL